MSLNSFDKSINGEFIRMFLRPCVALGRGRLAPFYKSIRAQCFSSFHRIFADSNAVMLMFILGASSTLLLAELPTPLVLLPALIILWVAFRQSQIVLVALIALILGFLYTLLQFQLHQDHILPKAWERKDIAVTVKITGLPQIRGKDIKFTARIQTVEANRGLELLQGQQLRLSCYRCPFALSASDVWQFTVRLKKPSGYASEGAFDYEKYLFRERTVATGYVRTKDGYQRVGVGKSSFDQWRLGIKNRIESALPESNFARAAIIALSIGDKSGFSLEHRELLQKSGLSHLFAISGLHVGMVFALALLLSKWCLNLVPRLFEYWPRPYLTLMPAFACAAVYSAMAGFAVSTQRALVMLSVFMVCRLVCRETSLLRVLLVAACLLLLFDPFSILDAGFWLSCGAVLIIHLASWKLEKGATLSLLKLQPMLWLGMLPLSVLFFGRVSLVSPLINLIAVPICCALLIPVTLLAVVTNELGWYLVAQPLFEALAIAFEWSLYLLERVTELPLAVIDVNGLWAISLTLIALAVLVVKRESRLSLLVWPAVVFSLLGLSISPVQTHDLRITLLDVGQGLSMVVQSAQGVTVYDTGPKYSSGFSATAAVLLPYLRAKGINKVDRLVISHADNDHIGGLDVLRENIPVAEIITSRPDKIPRSLACRAGDGWNEGATQFKFLSPHNGTPKGSNNRSCVLKISHQGVSVLLTGDIEKKVERFLVKRNADLRADVLLVPHQGSKTSSTETFLAAVNPELALVAAGYRNHYGHPHQSVIERYQRRDIQVLSTIDSGTIELEIGGGEYRYSSFRSARKRFWHRE